VAVRTLTHARARTRTGRSFLPVLVIWSSWLVLMTGANLATPLYAVYASTFGFSSLVAFIACIYFVVASAVIGTGLLDLGLSLSASVEAVAALLAAGALAGVVWQLRGR
jgi:hypothetical protein